MIDYLKRHPLVWIVPVAFFTIGVGLLAWRIGSTPASPFIYDL